VKDCDSAPEVWERVRRVKAFRDRLMPRAQPLFVRTPPEPEPEPAPPPPSPPPVQTPLPDGMRVVVEAVAKHCRVSRREMMSWHRDQYLVETRHLAFILIRILYNRSTPEIGIFFRDRDHTTVMHGLRKYEQTVKYLKQHGLHHPLDQLIEVTIFLMRTEAAINGRQFPKLPRG